LANKPFSKIPPKEKSKDLGGLNPKVKQTEYEHIQCVAKLFGILFT